MDSNLDKHETTKIAEFQKKGYTANYLFRDGRLHDVISKKAYTAAEITIIEQYRYEGMSNPEDMSILYALEMVDGTKGTLLMAYGPAGDGDLAWFMKDVKFRKK